MYPQSIPAHHRPLALWFSDKQEHVALLDPNLLVNEIFADGRFNLPLAFLEKDCKLLTGCL
jgi:hypothetical protein